MGHSIIKAAMTKKPKIAIIAVGAVSVLVIAGGVVAYDSLFGAPQKQAEPERFVISLDASEQDTIQKLHEQGFIKSERGFGYALGKAEIQPGGYKISKSMTAWETAEALAQKPYMKWVVIPEGLRKEQVAELLADELGWTAQQKEDWISKYTAMKYDEIEGVYFPDTYLIPVDEKPLQIADRLRAKFNEKFQPYTDKFSKVNIKWTTALKLASIVQREAAGKDDMPLVAGIFWNRLLKDMKLEADATVQYARDTRIHFPDDPCENPEYRNRHSDYCFNPSVLQPTATYISEGGWWKPITTADLKADSKYNTYLYAGLPPHPISNPGLDAIDAVLNSAETECLYYLHDPSGQIHCSKTYEKHQANIEQFLK